MSDNAVNAKITDAVAQNSASVLGVASAQALGSLYQVASHANGMAMQNAVSNQQNLNQLNAVIVADAIAILQGK